MILSQGAKTAVNSDPDCQTTQYEGGSATDDCSYILLLFAARDGDIKTVRFLLENNAAVDVRNAHGATALHFAASGGHRAVARVLLKHGASVNATDISGKTPLLQAAANGDSKLVRLFLKHGANASVSDVFGWTAQRLAASTGNYKVLATLQYYNQRKSCWESMTQRRSYRGHSVSTAISNSTQETNQVETGAPFSIAMIVSTTKHEKNVLKPLRSCLYYMYYKHGSVDATGVAS
ncbi:hypothetical protein BBO99_00001004 [Phytophthora kernoviae]|uniref:Uncharacterized protein n=2 Tax=Phytophthora kernoviae TaxID=325452 RepID=A0A421H158_9STRA|nr:hypothetical protein G195_003599 [Phytophthora kernoviae 00238/432]KAG2529890.1 hypothetical protein JM16_001762 [Phytophthora kernoviae]KAG2531717.1 hypothetical protein JM18_000970 [Phytophthora kernoviae]RLN46476.1 hypothetical protein BBI17_000905 [Phytophthora kernoviae]RLN84878.1 hypothetical protein BBO99_00001004 [Phytophthora kernoviae]